MTQYILTDNPTQVIVNGHTLIPDGSTINNESRFWKGDGLVECYQDFLNGGGTPIEKQPSEFHELVGEVWVHTLAGAQAATWEKIKSERERRTLGGFYEPVSLKWFHSDSISSKQQLALVIMGAGIPVGLQWKTMDGSFVEMTQALAGQVFAAAAANDQAVFAAAEVHKAAMLLEADPLAYDFSTGWPLMYGE